MGNTFFDSISLQGFLSFAPDCAPIKLEALNVLIGANGSGKSNLIEAFELLAATPFDLVQAVRDGGGALEWLWKGPNETRVARIETILAHSVTGRPLRYAMAFANAANRFEIIDEAIGEESIFYYRFLNGHPIINAKDENGNFKERFVQKESLYTDQSILSQRKDPEAYPEITWLGRYFSDFLFLREWSFGRYTPVRKPQSTSLPNNRLLSDCSNLANVLNKIEHSNVMALDGLIRRYLPRFSRLTTLVDGGSIQFFLHERDLSRPIPAARLSDGTLRFLAILAALLVETPPSLLCIEEPELGQHPDAVILIAELLKEASKRTQMLITTHSEALISALSDEPQAVLVCENQGFGTEIHRIDRDKMQEWLETYSLGDLWRSGELGGNP